MTLVSLLITLAICGFIVWLILMIPMPQVFKNIILGIVALFLILWLLQQLGVETGLAGLRLK